jgi:hypothetical protein
MYSDIVRQLTKPARDVEGHGGGEDQSVLMGSITTIY